MCFDPKRDDMILGLVLFVIIAFCASVAVCMIRETCNRPQPAESVSTPQSP